MAARQRPLSMISVGELLEPVDPMPPLKGPDRPSSLKARAIPAREEEDVD